MKGQTSKSKPNLHESFKSCKASALVSEPEKSPTSWVATSVVKCWVRMMVYDRVSSVYRIISRRHVCPSRRAYRNVLLEEAFIRPCELKMLNNFGSGCTSSAGQQGIRPPGRQTHDSRSLNIFELAHRTCGYGQLGAELNELQGQRSWVSSGPWQRAGRRGRAEGTIFVKPSMAIWAQASFRNCLQKTCVPQVPGAEASGPKSSSSSSGFRRVSYELFFGRVCPPEVLQLRSQNSLGTKLLPQKRANKLGFRRVPAPCF